MLNLGGHKIIILLFSLLFLTAPAMQWQGPPQISGITGPRGSTSIQIEYIFEGEVQKLDEVGPVDNRPSTD